MENRGIHPQKNISVLTKVLKESNEALTIIPLPTCNNGFGVKKQIAQQNKLELK